MTGFLLSEDDRCARRKLCWREILIGVAMYYHVSPQPLADGLELEPGEFGRKLRGVGVNDGVPNSQVSFYWEIALETARLSIHPDLPSRLTSTFLWRSLAAACVFRHRYRQGGEIHEIELVGDHPIFCGDFTLITAPPVNQPYLDYMPQLALKYWQQAGQPAVAEFLYPGPIRIIRSVQEVPQEIQEFLDQLQ